MELSGVASAARRTGDLLKMSRKLLFNEEYVYSEQEIFHYNYYNFSDGFNNSDACCCCEANHNCSNALSNFAHFIDILNVYYIPVLIVVGFIGNFLSCLVLLTTHLKLRSSSYYLAALAVADSGYLVCIFVVYCSSKEVFELYNRQGFCQFFIYLTYVCSFLSVWLIVAFTVERFIAVHYPLRRPYICTVSRAKTIVFSLTGIGVVSYTFAFWAAGLVNGVCQLRPDFLNVAKVVNSIDTVITLVLPIILIVGMNAMIARSLFRFRKKLHFDGVLSDFGGSEKTELCSSQSSASKKSKDHSQDLESTGSKKIMVFRTFNDNEKYSHIHVKKSSRYATSVQIQQNINKMLLVISSVFIALNFPSYLLRLCGYFQEMLEESGIKNFLGCAQLFAMLLYYTNFSINFLLYTMCGETFRMCLRTLFKNIMYKIININK